MTGEPGPLGSRAMNGLGPGVRLRFSALLHQHIEIDVFQNRARKPVDIFFGDRVFFGNEEPKVPVRNLEMEISRQISQYRCITNSFAQRRL